MAEHVDIQSVVKISVSKFLKRINSLNNSLNI